MIEFRATPAPLTAPRPKWRGVSLRACAIAVAIMLSYGWTESSQAQSTYIVTENTDNGVGPGGVSGVSMTLSQAIFAANADPGSTIEFDFGMMGTNTITLTNSVLAITNNVIINGTDGVNFLTIDGFDGVNSHQVFTVSSGNDVQLQNMTITRALSRGADGGDGAGGGGGGLGGGGALYIGQNNNPGDANIFVTIQNVTFQNNTSQGGAGGDANGTNNGGAGGGYNFNSNSATAGQGGGAGGDAANAVPALRNGQPGPFGGGGGSSNTGTQGGAGNGGGNGGANGVGGNGGLALGGAVFVANNANLIVMGPSDIDPTNQAIGGAAGNNGATAGTGSGGGLYVGIGTTTTFTATADINITGTIYSNGLIVVNGPNIVTFSGTNTFSGYNDTVSPVQNTTVNAGGTLRGTTNSLGGTITDNGNVNFTQGFAGTFAGAISGNGSVTVTSGDITFSTYQPPPTSTDPPVLPPPINHTYSGGTFITGGSLTGNTNTLQGAITNNSSLIFNQAFDGTYAGVMTGNGTLTKNGAGFVTLSGNSTNGGTTLLNAGGLLVDGTLNTTGGNITTLANTTLRVNGTLGNAASNTTIAADSLLSGFGTINGNVINNGVVLLGNTIGDMNVNGDFTFSNSSTYAVRINAAGTTPGVNNDVIHVAGTGNVNLDGQVFIAAAPGAYLPGMTYTILTHTGARNGAFDGATVTGVSGAFLNANLVYGAGVVQFTLSTAYANVAQTFNQAQVAQYLDTLSGTATGDLQTVMGQLNTLSPAGLRSALEQLNGEVAASAGQLAIQGTVDMYRRLRRRFDDDAFNRLRLRDPVFPPPADEAEAQEILSRTDGPQEDFVFVNFDPANGRAIGRRITGEQPLWTGMVDGYGLGGNVQSDGNASGGFYGIGGTLLTLTRDLDLWHQFGFFAAYNHMNLRAGNTNQSISLNDEQIGTYFRRDEGTRYLFAAGSVGFDAYSTNRPIQFGTINRAAGAKFNGWQASSLIEAGIRRQTYRSWYFEPFVGLQYVYLRQSDFAETGGGSLNLASEGLTANSLRNLLGLRLVGNDRFGWWRPAPGGRLCPELRFLWLHEYLSPVSAFSSAFAGIGGPAFTTDGLNFGRDWVQFGGGLKWDLSPAWSAYMDYDLQFNGRQAYHVGAGGISRSF